jgi:hypothetical protein
MRPAPFATCNSVGPDFALPQWLGGVWVPPVGHREVAVLPP